MSANYDFDIENKRISQLAKYDLLNLRKVPELDIFAETVCLITDSPGSLVAVMERELQTIQSCVLLNIETVVRKNTMCQFAVNSKEMLLIEDTLLDQRALDNEMLMQGKIRFYVSVPLIDAEGYVLGTICAVDFKPKTLSQDQINSLHKLASAVTKLLTSRKIDIYAEFFFETFNITNNFICVLDQNLVFKECNPAFKNTFLQHNETLIKNTFSEFFTINESAQIAIENLLTHKESVEISVTHHLPNKEEIITEWQLRFDTDQSEILGFGRNVTIERIEKQRLESSERKFRKFFDNGHGLMCMHDMEGNILEVNQKGCEVLQYTQEELNQFNLADLLIDKQKENFATYLKRVFENQEDSGVLGLKTKSGQKLLYLFHSMLVYNDQNEPYVISSSLNITERIKLEKDLLKTTELLEQISLVAQVGGWEFDLENNSLLWSDTTKIIHGLPTTYQPSFETALDFYESNSKSIVTEHLKNAIENGVAYDIELQIVKADQSVIWTRVKGIPQFENGVCKRVFGIIQDTDVSKKMYEESNKRKSMLQAFINDVPASVAMFDTELKYLAVSNRWLDEFGATFKAVKGKKLFKKNSEYATDRMAIYQNAVKGIPYKNENEILHLPNQEHPQNYSIEVLPWRLDNGNVGGVIVFIKNITNEVKANEELKAAKTTADLASKAKSEFLANMSHEIRTPLNGVIGFSDLLLQTPLNEIQTQYLNYINDSGNTLLTIINDILDLSKIESGKLELFIDQQNIYEVANQVANVVLYQVQQKNIELLLNIEQGLPSALFFDDIRLKQVLINLLGNAVKFTHEGEIELKIEKVAKTEQNIRLKISVRDTGIGIPLEKQHHIFNAFTQEDSSVSKRYGGTGLGLTISNNILQYMGSSLSINSEVGKGATFFFEIDLKYNDHQIAELDVLPIKKVLIIDDNDKNRLIIQEMLRFKDIESVQASNGLEALQLLIKGAEFDMILVDYHMPILSGIETMDKIKELFANQNKQAPFIVLHTSSQEQEVLSKINTLNSTYCLMKPVNASQLYKTINKILTQNVSEENTIETAETANAFDQSLKVLVADDNMINLILNKKIMSNLTPNAILTEVTDGQKAIEECQLQQFDLILMDVQMPNLDGIQATKIIRELSNYSQTPIIGVTAGNVKGEKEKCIEAGMNDVLTKPIRQHEVKNMLSIYLEQPLPILSKDVISQYYNEEIIDEQLGDDPTFKKFFLETVLAELIKSKVEIASNQQDFSHEQMIAFLHKLKGSAATAGLFNLAQLVSEYENSCNDASNYQHIIRDLNYNLSISIEIIKQQII